MARPVRNKTESCPRLQSGTRCRATLSSPFVSLGTSRNASPNVLMLFGSSRNCCVTIQNPNAQVFRRVWSVLIVWLSQRKMQEECQWKVTRHKAQAVGSEKARRETGAKQEGTLISIVRISSLWVCLQKQTNKERNEEKCSSPCHLSCWFSAQSPPTLCVSCYSLRSFSTLDSPWGSHDRFEKELVPYKYTPVINTMIYFQQNQQEQEISL